MSPKSTTVARTARHLDNEETGRVTVLRASRSEATYGFDYFAAMTELDGADAGPRPALFRAVTVQVYVFPTVNPFTTIVNL